MTTIQEFHKQSIENPDAFWGEEAKRIDWHKPFTQVLDFLARRSPSGSSAAKPTFATTPSTGTPPSGRMTARWSSSRPRPTRKSSIRSPN
jgi:hypothetical protein